MDKEPSAKDFDCVAFNGTRLDEENSVNNQWMTGLPSAARWVDLSGCGLKTLGSGLSHLREVRVLNLAYNALRMIEEENFKGLTNLKILLMEGHFLKASVMKEMGRAEDYARLEPLQNNITRIHPSAFVDNPQLTVLGLENNGLREIPKGIFATQFTTKSLRVLRLTQNSIDLSAQLLSPFGPLGDMPDSTRQVDINEQGRGTPLEDWMDKNGHYIDDDNGDKSEWWRELEDADAAYTPPGWEEWPREAWEDEEEAAHEL